MEITGFQTPCSQELKTKIDEINRIIPKCLLLVSLSGEYLVDKRYHIQVNKIRKLMIDSWEFGYNAASTINSSEWLICEKCLKKGRKSHFEKEECAVCKNSRKKISKINPKSIRTMKFNIINDIRHYIFYYCRFLDFMSRLTEQIKNNEHIRKEYLSYFKGHEEQILKSEHSYLKQPSYYMCHYDTANPSKRKTCSLTKNDILNVKINDNEYNKLIMDAVEKKPIDKGPERLMAILDKYRYPKEFALEKTFIDFMKISLKKSDNKK